MLNKSTIKQANKYCCQDISFIENYEDAVNSDKRYCCHHKNGIDKSTEELKEEGLYYDRPASELIFLTISEHCKLHKKGENHPRYGKGYLIAGEKHPLYGKHHTDTTKQKMSDAKKGANHPMAKQCTINGLTYGCLKDAYEDIKPEYTYQTFRNKYRNNKL